MIGGRLLQTDKRFSSLKMSQKEKISDWLYEEYAKLYDKNKLPPDKRYNDYVLNNVYEKIFDADIWIPFYELRKYFVSRKNHFRKRYEKTKGVSCDNDLI